MQSRHILPLTSVRFFAAMWVVVHHFPLTGMPFHPFPWLVDFLKFGYQAVPFFFILSGFILGYNYFPTYSLARHPEFVFLRFARLWPVHAVALLLSDSPTRWTVDRVAELFMVRSWYKNTVFTNPPAWSISAEWFAYLCLFPLAWAAFKRIRSVPVLAGIVLALLVAESSIVNYILSSWFNKCGTILFPFLAGAGLYQIKVVAKNLPAEGLVWSALALFLAFMLFHQHLSVLVLFLSFALMILGLSYERGVVAKILSHKALVWGGLVSYSLYMTHYLVIESYIYFTWSYWKTWGHSALAAVLIPLCMTVVFIGTAGAMYHFVEAPANRGLRRVLDKFKHQPAFAHAIITSTVARDR
jgi:peptidoglycan/LPS O-acetylase OafA/YrhL